MIRSHPSTYNRKMYLNIQHPFIYNTPVSRKKNVSIFVIFCAHFPIVFMTCMLYPYPVLLMVFLLVFYGFIAILNQIWYAIRILIAWYSSNYIFFRCFWVSCRLFLFFFFFLYISTFVLVIYFLLEALTSV